jgi:CRP-like cAMP-binding protein
MLEAVADTMENPRASLRDVVLAELELPSLPRKRVAAGSLIMQPEAATECLYFVADGRIRLYRLAPTGEQVFQGELGPGDCLKCPRILCQHECHAFAEAIVDTTLEVLSKPLFDRLRRDSKLFNQILVRELSDQMAELDRRLYESLVMPDEGSSACRAVANLPSPPRWHTHHLAAADASGSRRPDRLAAGSRLQGTESAGKGSGHNASPRGHSNRSGGRATEGNHELERQCGGSQPSASGIGSESLSAQLLNSAECRHAVPEKSLIWINQAAGTLWQGAS